METEGVFNVSGCLTGCNSGRVGSLLQKIKRADCYIYIKEKNPKLLVCMPVTNRLPKIRRQKRGGGAGEGGIF